MKKFNCEITFFATSEEEAIERVIEFVKQIPSNARATLTRQEDETEKEKTREDAVKTKEENEREEMLNKKIMEGFLSLLKYLFPEKNKTKKQ